MADTPVKTPISPGMIRRAMLGLKYAFTGKAPSADWFGPKDPLEPTAPPEVAGRAWDYPVGANLQYQPRSSEPISFDMLRALADNYDLLRLVIETRKDQLVKFDWQIKPKEGAKENKAAISEVESFLAFPDRFHTWQQWLRMIIEDMLVIDAATIYPRKTLGGQLYSLDPVDGATIKVLVDQTGRSPEPPLPAYQQILKGMPATEYQRDQLVYSPRNVRTNKFYGYGPVEQIIMTVNLAMRRQMFQLNYYTEGNMPEALLAVPPEWTVDHIKEMQEYWDALLSGNLEERRKVRFVPAGVSPFMFKETLLKDDMDEWLARIVCFCFNLPPTAFVRQMNRATAQTAQETALQEGLIPLMTWVKDLIDQIINAQFGYPELEFAWKQEKEIDPQIQAQIDANDVRAGIRTIDEVRESRGLDPYPDEMGAKPLIYTAGGAVTLESVFEPPPEPPVIAPLAIPGPDETKEPDNEPGKEPPAPEPPKTTQKTFMAEIIAKAYKAGLI